ncbi:MAG: hypothetical protein LUD84_11060 [Clostridiales bacterium]|nr:hypothetical protein [Clostridiales bacterium]
MKDVTKWVTPTSWRKAWTLHRAVTGVDSYGDPTRTWDMDNADYTGEDDQANGVCWQILSREAAVKEFGESVTGAAQFNIFDATVEISEFDRCVFDGRVWEARGIADRSWFRHITLVEVVFQ